MKHLRQEEEDSSGEDSSQMDIDDSRGKQPVSSSQRRPIPPVPLSSQIPLSSQKPPLSNTGGKGARRGRMPSSSSVQFRPSRMSRRSHSGSDESVQLLQVEDNFVDLTMEEDEAPVTAPTTSSGTSTAPSPADSGSESRDSSSEDDEDGEPDQHPLLPEIQHDRAGSIHLTESESDGKAHPAQTHKTKVPRPGVPAITFPPSSSQSHPSLTDHATTPDPMELDFLESEPAPRLDSSSLHARPTELDFLESEPAPRLDSTRLHTRPTRAGDKRPFSAVMSPPRDTEEEPPAPSETICRTVSDAFRSPLHPLARLSQRRAIDESRQFIDTIAPLQYTSTPLPTRAPARKKAPVPKDRVTSVKKTKFTFD